MTNNKLKIRKIKKNHRTISISNETFIIVSQINFTAIQKNSIKMMINKNNLINKKAI